MSKATELLEKYPIEEEAKTGGGKVDPALTKLIGETDPDTIIKISRQVKRLNAEDFNAVVEALRTLHEQDDDEDEEDDEEKYEGYKIKDVKENINTGRATNMLEKYGINEININHPLIKKAEKLADDVIDLVFDKIKPSKDFSPQEKKAIEDGARAFQRAVSKVRKG